MATKAIKEVDTHVGAKVRDRRVALSMSQTKLAEGLGVTFQQVQKYEKGTNRIGSSRLVQIANALNVPPAFFFEGAPTATRAPPSQMASITSFVASKEGRALMKAFVKLPKDVQRSVVALVDKIVANGR